ncbi:MAG TPA: hypothetical protein VKT70_03910 [Stellaceae bacterium]|nr:hypothetical protein [Stellaceae bacterium]
MKKPTSLIVPLPVEPDLLASAVFLFTEHLNALAAEQLEEEEEVEIDTKAVLDLLADELDTDVQTTLNLYLRLTALYRLFAQSPALASLAIEREELGGALSEDALLAASRLDLHVHEEDDQRAADFDPREFREALLP